MKYLCIVHFDGSVLETMRNAISTKTDFLRQLGRREDARVDYLAAMALTGAEAERRFIERRLREIETSRPFDA